MTRRVRFGGHDRQIGETTLAKQPTVPRLFPVGNPHIEPFEESDVAEFGLNLGVCSRLGGGCLVGGGSLVRLLFDRESQW